MRWGKLLGRVSNRRPLIALVALVLALAIGYAVDALSAHHGSHKPGPGSSVSVTAPSTP